MLTVYGIPNCDTVKKARAWLDARGFAYAFHDYKKAGIDAASLHAWADAVGVDRLLNRRGTTWRKVAEADRAAVEGDPTGAAAIALMVRQPSLIKRPVVTGADRILVGFDADEWERVLGAG